MLTKRWIPALLVLPLVASCGSSQNPASPAGQTDPNGSVTVRGAEPQTDLLPANSTDPTSGQFLDAVYDKLVRADGATGKTENLAAESITTTDSKVYHVKLRKGMTFHDGTEVKARNFVDAWNYAAYGPNAQTASSFFNQIQGFDEVNQPTSTVKAMSGLKVLGDDAFDVTLKAPFSVFTSKISYTPFAPLPDIFFKDPKAFAAAPVGNGRFRFVSRTPNQEIRLTRFDSYQGEHKVHFKDLTIKMYSNPETAYKDVLSDTLDFTTTIPPSAKVDGKYLKDLGDRVVNTKLFSVHMLTVPWYRKEYTLDVRRAISMAINRDQITRTVLAGTFTPADGWVPDGIEGYEPGVCGEWCKFDPAKAKELFAKSGFTGKISLLSNTDGTNKETMEAICNSVKNALGTDCQFVPVSVNGEFRKMVRNKELTGIARGGWSADYPSIENFLNEVFRTGASGNDAAYSDPEMDALLDRASSTADQATAIKLFQQAHHLVTKDFVLIPTWTAKGIAATSKRVRDARMDFRSQLDLSSVKVVSEKR